MKDDTFFLHHILDEIMFLEEQFHGKSFEDLLDNPLLQRASIRSLEIIGEAVKNLSDNLKSSNPDIKWKEIAGMRDKLIHHYFGVDLEVVWDVVENRLPELRITVKNALK